MVRGRARVGTRELFGRSGFIGRAVVVRVGRGGVSMESGASGKSESWSESEDWSDSGSFRPRLDMMGGGAGEGGEGGEVVGCQEIGNKRIGGKKERVRTRFQLNVSEFSGSTHETPGSKPHGRSP